MPTRGGGRAEWALLGPDQRVALVAERQRGTITYAQLLRCGLTHDQVRGRITRGQLHRLHRGVYVVGHRVLAPLAHETAALLACGAGTVLNRRTSAILWDLPVLTDPVDVNVPPSRNARGHKGIDVSRHVLAPHEIRRRHGLPVTSPARTRHDLAPDHDAEELEHLIAEAVARRLVRRGEVQAVSGRRGARTVRQATTQGPKWTRSEAERALKRLVRDAGLPEPGFNERIAGFLVDAVWHEHRIALEVDSWAWHGHRHRFERDRDRDLKVREAGFTPVRLTARQLAQEPIRCAAHLARLTTPAPG